MKFIQLPQVGMVIVLLILANHHVQKNPNEIFQNTRMNVKYNKTYFAAVSFSSLVYPV